MKVNKAKLLVLVFCQILDSHCLDHIYFLGTALFIHTCRPVPPPLGSTKDEY